VVEEEHVGMVVGREKITETKEEEGRLQTLL
jgi:hypothetical protein